MCMYLDLDVCYWSFIDAREGWTWLRASGLLITPMKWKLSHWSSEFCHLWRSWAHLASCLSCLVCEQNIVWGPLLGWITLNKLLILDVWSPVAAGDEDIHSFLLVDAQGRKSRVAPLPAWCLVIPGFLWGKQVDVSMSWRVLSVWFCAAFIRKYK